MKDYFSTPIMKAARKILLKIESLNYEAVIVGGCVRDILLDIEPNDVDISTNCPMRILEENFNICADIGKNKQFGILIIEMDGYRFEVAQYRIEMYKKPLYVERI